MPKENDSRRRNPPVGPRLRNLLTLTALLTTVLAANSVYLAGVTLWETATGGAFENLFYQYMFLAHVTLGLLLIVPLLAFVVVHWRNVRRPGLCGFRQG